MRYDGQTKAERQGAPRVCVTLVDVTRTIAGTLGASAAGVYSVLDTYCDVERKAWPSEQTLASGCRLSVKQMRRVLHALAAAGWIEIHERKNQFGFVFGNEYLVKNHVTPSNKTGDMAGTSLGHGEAKDVPLGNIKVTEKVKPKTEPAPPLDDASHARLQTFKLAYPVKRRSANARALAQEWGPLTIAEQEAAIASLSVFVNSKEWQDEDGRYIPNILKFLNERRWESVPQTASVSLRPTDYGYYGSTGLQEFREAVRRGEIAGVTPAMVEARA